MANCFARVEFVKRSEGKNVCAKSAYISRSKVHFQGNKFQESKIYNWSYIEKPVYQEILLPEFASDKLKDRETLWNLCENFEGRKNSQPAFEQVLALPDDRIISIEDRKILLKTFVEKHFVSDGFAAEVAIHQPDKKDNKEHNWHAHVLVTGRKIDSKGETLEERKPRAFFSKLSNTKWYQLWTDHQNTYFEEKGLSLRVDPTGIISQKHLGPVRMRGQAMSLIIENESLKDLNQLESLEPAKILEKITETQSVFVPEEVDRFLHRNVLPENVSRVRHLFWKQDEIIELLEKQSGERTHKYTTKDIVEEESKIFRLADKLHGKLSISTEEFAGLFTKKLSKEQGRAFENIVNGRRLSCLDGHAGTGKSYLLTAIKDYYQSEGVTVRAFGPDNTTAKVLKGKGFKDSQNIYKFLFSKHYSKQRKFNNNEVWIIDEAGKLGNQPLLELLKVAEKHQIQLIFSGSASQLPSVSRGGAFGLFCSRYGSQKLMNIQRQRQENHREMASSFAYGKVSEAVNQLQVNGGLKWSGTHKEAMSNLIDHWTKDLQNFPVSSSLIIARSNRNVRLLNEMARASLKSIELISLQDYKCETTFGTIFVSEGDRILFRENNKALGVTNGEFGTLVKASTDQFTIVINEETGKSKTVSFNPKEYCSFQLGYATTTYRSQGDTVNRAYVCYSKGMNKKEMYVAMTRHVNNVNLFVSREEAGTLSHLKKSINQDRTALSTVEYTTKESLENLQIQEKRAKEVERLKSSDQMVERLIGRGKSLFDYFSKAAGSITTTMNDRVESFEFYNPSIQKRETKGDIMKVEQPEKETSVCSKQKAIENYQNKVEAAQVYYELSAIQSDELSIDISKVKGFNDWQKACGERNQAANELKRHYISEELISIFGEKGKERVEKQARVHEEVKSKFAKSDLSYEQIEIGLRGNIEKLLYRLFPDGPSRKEGNRFRYGSKGSLCVNVSGSKEGLFYNFETQEGGGLIKLIESSQTMNTKEAIAWAKEFINFSDNIQLKKNYQTLNLSKATEKEWVTLKPNSEAPSLEVISKGYFSKKYREEARYSYKDREGNTFFYTVRLVEKEDPSKKIVLPLTYGHWKNNSKKTFWAFKQYNGTGRPIYNQHLVFENPSKPILIVEGEKSADAASRKFPDYICVTWSGGAGAVNKTDWSILKGRDLIIWPDNDQAGYKAAKEIAFHLRKEGVSRLKVIGEEQLSSDFPLKWDLADSNPKGKTDQDILDILLNAREKAINPKQIAQYIRSIEENHPADLSRVNEVLWRVDERMRGELESKCQNRTHNVHKEIISASAKLLLKEEAIKEKLSKDLHINEKLSRRVAFQAILHEAEKGSEPSKETINSIQEKVAAIDWSNKYNHIKDSREKNFLIDYSITLSAKKLSDNEIASLLQSKESSISSQKNVVQNIPQQERKQLEL